MISLHFQFYSLIFNLLGYSQPSDSQNDQTQIQILDEVNLQVVEQEQAIRQLEVSIKRYLKTVLLKFS